MTTETIKPYVDGEPGSKPAPPAVIHYDGGSVVQTPASQRASAAASEFAKANPDYIKALQSAKDVKGINNLDVASQQRLNELRQRMRSSRPKPATVINLHPWPLQFSGSDLFLRGIYVPACNPGQPFAYQHIRSYRVSHEYNEDGTFEFAPILAIDMAGQFLRDFSNADIYGGGIVIYEGEGHPDKIEEVETYDQQGKLQTVREVGIEYDEENRAVQVPVDVPVKKSLAALISQQRKVRNDFYLNRVKLADQNYNRPDGKGKSLVTNLHCLMADVLFAEGIIAAVPNWDLKGSVELGLRDEPCPSCGGTPKAEAFKCVSCGHVLNAFDAYMNGAIEHGHASMDLLSGEEWELVEKENERRKSQRAEGKKRLAETKKAEKATD